MERNRNDIIAVDDNDDDGGSSCRRRSICRLCRSMCSIPLNGKSTLFFVVFVVVVVVEMKSAHTNTISSECVCVCVRASMPVFLAPMIMCWLILSLLYTVARSTSCVLPFDGGCYVAGCVHSLKSIAKCDNGNTWNAQLLEPHQTARSRCRMLVR